MLKTRSFVLLLVVALAVAGAASAGAWFVDTETTDDNSLTAGTLDLELNGMNPYVPGTWTVTNMRPGQQPKKSFTCKNVGSVKGYLFLKSIKITSYENGREEPEKEAGDTTGGNPGKGNGELQKVVSMGLFFDKSGNGWYGGPADGEFWIVPQATLMKNAPSSITNGCIPLDPGAEEEIECIVNWWNSTGTDKQDSRAMSDSVDVEFVFELYQDDKGLCP